MNIWSYRIAAFLHNFISNLQLCTIQLCKTNVLNLNRVNGLLCSFFLALTVLSSALWANPVPSLDNSLLKDQGIGNVLIYGLVPQNELLDGSNVFHDQQVRDNMVLLGYACASKEEKVVALELRKKLVGRLDNELQQRTLNQVFSYFAEHGQNKGDSFLKEFAKFGDSTLISVIGEVVANRPYDGLIELIVNLFCSNSGIAGEPKVCLEQKLFIVNGLKNYLEACASGVSVSDFLLEGILLKNMHTLIIADLGLYSRENAVRVAMNSSEAGGLGDRFENMGYFLLSNFLGNATRLGSSALGMLSAFSFFVPGVLTTYSSVEKTYKMQHNPGHNNKCPYMNAVDDCVYVDCKDQRVVKLESTADLPDCIRAGLPGPFEQEEYCSVPVGHSRYAPKAVPLFYQHPTHASSTNDYYLYEKHNYAVLLVKDGTQCVSADLVKLPPETFYTLAAAGLSLVVVAGATSYYAVKKHRENKVLQGRLGKLGEGQPLSPLPTAPVHLYPEVNPPAYK